MVAWWLWVADIISKVGVAISTMETLEREVFDLVYKLGASHLDEVCDHLKISDIEGKSSSQIKRKVIRKLSEVEEGETGGEEVVEGYFKEIKELMLNLLDPERRSSPLSTKTLGNRGNMGGGGVLKEEESADDEDPDIKKFRKMFMKELKFNGRIGEAGHKDTMSYTSLYYQIRSARQQGYSDREIQTALIKSINSNLEVRAYLEGKADLTFDTMMKTIRAHYKEPDATSLFTTLSTARQLGHESAQDFAMRLMTLKQKILFVSQEESGEYSEGLVRDRFLHTMLTGLKNDAVRAELRPLLKRKKTTDEELLESLRFAVADEVEHQNKFNAGPKKQATVAGIQSKEEDTETQKSKKESPLMKELADLKTQVMELTAKYAEASRHDGGRDYRDRDSRGGNRDRRSRGNHGNNNKDRRDRNRQNKCGICIQDGVQKCEHCFICFSTEHFSRGCKQRNPRGETKNN